MRVEFLKELLENPIYQNMTVANFVKDIKESGIWDFDPKDEAIELLKQELKEVCHS